MEKLCYVVWAPAGASGPAFAERVLAEAGPALLDTPVRGLSLLLSDAEAVSVQRARITHLDEPPGGMVCAWLDCVDDRGLVEAALAPHVARYAGYLVTESVPLPNTTHRVPLGQRTPGITMLACLEKPERLDDETWLSLWHGSHTPLAMEIQCTWRYVRNVVARPLTRHAPPWRGLVEEAFPTEAVTDPARWYDAVGDPEKLRERVGRMIASCQRFLDLDRVESHPLGEYVLR